jgi:hypothetical protein
VCAWLSVPAQSTVPFAPAGPRLLRSSNPAASPGSICGAAGKRAVSRAGYRTLTISSRYGRAGTHGSRSARFTSRNDTVPTAYGPVGAGSVR